MSANEADLLYCPDIRRNVKELDGKFQVRIIGDTVCEPNIVVE
jgi:hypothetical protein